MRGPANRHSTTNRNANVTVSQKIWLGNVCDLNGGQTPPWGTVVPLVRLAVSAISGVHQDERDQQAEQSLQFAKRVTDIEVRELALGGTRIAQCSGNVVSEHDADADTGAHERDGRKTGADEFSCVNHIHVGSPFVRQWLS